MVGTAAERTRSTICAVASAPGAGERAVVRASGPLAFEAVRGLCRDADGQPLAPQGRGLHEVQVDDGVGTQPALLVWMPGPGSYTREDVAEWHLVGNPALVRAVLRRLGELGLEPAGPGEFTRRAFENGRLDLTRAEGVLALVEARNSEELRAAGSLLAGGLGGRIAALREVLEHLRALTEASLDFDQQDTGHVPLKEISAALDEARADLLEARTWERRRTPASGLARVVLAGLPNAGKSALFNRLTLEGDEHRAIESDQAGTTRDAKVGRLALPGGQEVLLVDTAGIDPLAEGVDAMAQDRRDLEWERADLLLELVESSGNQAASDNPASGPGIPRLIVMSKADLALSPHDPGGRLRVSSHTGSGLTALLAQIEIRLGLATQDDTPSRSNSGLERQLSERHRKALDQGLQELAQAQALLGEGAGLDLVAEALRGAGLALDRITGQTTPEDLLDRIFSRFCLGK
ncbi:MAG TPA: tRNA uridine-5-carboxymethylaminomethyl(34) synthesis GTPase MnmE [Planctomycetes bacterium]|nr:tRNA uridine-5-carboxymethylaminomethyl(34) synthesis GTPase MnmE [Planctomycetota bacterium]HIK61041.1 tRNA uridine-5-carboxymethylaminomethyl(34) synthesis GTPase MnmE [Planctomycetota bacterium]